MTLPKLAAAFQKAAARSREADDWARATRDFRIDIDGVDCLARCRVQVIVSPEGRSRRHLTGEIVVQVLSAAGEHVEAEPGWIHFSARDGAIADPAPLLQLAASEALANARRDPAFRASSERAALTAATPSATARPKRRL